MNVYSIPSFVAVLVNLLVGSYVLHKNPKKAENIIFALLAAAFAVWNLGDGISILTNDEATALLWSKIEWIGVSFLGSLFLHLALSFPEKRKILENKMALPAIYLPGFVFFALTLAGQTVNGLKTTYWAPYYQAHNPVVFAAYGIYFEITLFAGLYLFWKAYKTSQRELEKYQAKYMLVATAIPIIGGSLPDVILPAMGIHVFPTAGFLTAIMGLVIAYAITKHRLMSLMPIALENVVNGITQGVIISDAFGSIIKVNSSLEQILGIKQDAVAKKAENVMRSLLPKIDNAKEFEQLVEKANANPDELLNLKIVVCAPDKKFIDVSISPVKDEKGGIIGQVAIFYDITGRKKSEDELKKLNQELQSKVAELKRFNDIAVGRELKMIELKKRIKGLKGYSQGKQRK